MRGVRFAVGCALVVALAIPALAFGQSAPTLREAASSAFPIKQYELTLPTQQRLTPDKLAITESDEAVTDVAVEPPGAGTTGVILLVDASNSMQGAPIRGATAAARAFLAERKKDLPVAIVAFNSEQNELSGFTTDPKALSAAVANAPPLAEGTEIYDSLVTAAEMVKAQEGLTRATVVLLSDGTDVGSETPRADALAALAEANVKVISVGLDSPQYNPETLRTLALQRRGTYLETATPAELAPVFKEIAGRLSREYLVTYTSLLRPNVKANVRVAVAGLPPATATYTTPPLVLTPAGDFDKAWIDRVILSPWLMVFVIVSVLSLLAFTILTLVDARNRSVRRRMSQYVNVPTEEESRMRRAEVAALLAERAQRSVEGQRWWQNFERDVELAGFEKAPVVLAGWTLIGGILASVVTAVFFQSLWGLLVGLLAPLVTRAVVKNRIRSKRAAFAEELPDNLEVLAGALRAGHSLIGAMGVMVDGATEPSKSEFRRVLQDEQLGVPLDEALMVMGRRMDNLDIEQVAIVTRLQREAGGNTAEVLDRVVENIRGRMELRRMVRSLTAQGRIARYILTAIPIFLLIAFYLINAEWLEPLWTRTLGQAAMVAWVVMLIAGWFAIKKIVEIEV